MMYNLTGKNLAVNIFANETGAYIEGGHFGEINIIKSPIFKMTVKNIDDCEKTLITSETNWKNVEVKEDGSKTVFCFENPEYFDDICVVITATTEYDRLEWEIEVLNNNIDYSVMDITYPTPLLTAESYNYFIPLKSGYLVENANEKEFSETANYPGAYYVMQYLAAYGRTGGVYMGIEDGDACVKEFSANLKDGICRTDVKFYAIGASLPQNSFKVAGKSVWQYFDGDWYDASMIYKDFVQKSAKWLPQIGENGRCDTAEKYKNIPFWISDYIPNTESQGDNKPMNLSAGSDIYDESYWYEAAEFLKEKLGVPVAYHVYNWHEIPFNIEYPHFLPAKKVFTDRAKELQDKGLYVFPYINAMAWEIHDADMGHKINFNNTGCKCAAKNENGGYIVEHYPQKTVNNEPCSLAISCGSSRTWHKMMFDLSREMEETLDINGIYYDEVAASAARPCYNKEHNHIPGGGSYWIKGYNKMMKEIRNNRSNDNFYFTECNAEAYMKDFDGFLTWEWVEGNEVPAYAAVYAGYVQLIGRCTIGLKKDDFGFFKYCTAKSLLSGQQLGWCKADIVYSEKHIDFLKSAVDVRYKYSKLFNCSKMLRPPVVKTNLPKYETPSGLWFETPIVSEYVLSGAWQYRTGEKTVIFAVNINDGSADFEIEFNAAEYGIADKKLPDAFKLDGDICRVSGTIEKNEIMVWEI